MASSDSTKLISTESSSVVLYLEMSIFNDWVDVCMSTRYQQPVAVSTTRTVEHSVLSTALAVETLVGKARLPIPVQRQVHSE